MERLLSAALVAARLIAGIAVGLCSILATMDTLGLWLFRRPIASVVEISGMLLIVITFLGLGTAERHGDHIAVTLIRDFAPRAVQCVMDGIARLLSILVYLVLAAAGWAAASRSWRMNELSDGLVSFPVYPFRSVLVVGTVLAIFAAVSVLTYGTMAPKPSDPDGE